MFFGKAGGANLWRCSSGFWLQEVTQHLQSASPCAYCILMHAHATKGKEKHDNTWERRSSHLFCRWSPVLGFHAWAPLHLPEREPAAKSASSEENCKSSMEVDAKEVFLFTDRPTNAWAHPSHTSKGSANSEQLLWDVAQTRVSLHTLPSHKNEMQSLRVGFKPLPNCFALRLH